MANPINNSLGTLQVIDMTKNRHRNPDGSTSVVYSCTVQGISR
jgi:hypothetical protein